MIKEIIKRNYYASKFYYRLLHEYKWNISKGTILVHTPGHVGSSSVADSVRKNYSDFFFGNIHSLREKLDSNSPPNARFFLQQNIISRLETKKNEPWKIITIVRDPIARAITGFFQALGNYVPDYPLLREILPHKDLLSTLFLRFSEPDQIVFFLKGYSYLWGSVEHQIQWFDKDVQPFFGIDVFKSEFNQDKGYSIFKNKNRELLVIRLENLNVCWENACNDLFGEVIALEKRVNTASERSTYSIYKEFRDNLKVNEKTLLEIYESKYMRFFYNEEELTNMKQIWS
ncbi:MAG: hypothetical protein H6559_14270 [Lewinellaceae bacterium]|nr:hypothetical protein [Lewinellaceae bacterium]